MNSSNYYFSSWLFYFFFMCEYSCEREAFMYARLNQNKLRRTMITFLPHFFLIIRFLVDNPVHISITVLSKVHFQRQQPP